MRIQYVFAVLLLAGCATAPKYSWQHPGIDPASVDSQRAIDGAECQVYAMKAVPLPSPPSQQVAVAPIPSARSYTVTGSTTTYSSNGGISNGTYTGTVTEQHAFDPNQAVLAGEQSTEALFQSERQAAQYKAAVRAQANLADACMMKRGWVKVPTNPN